MREFIDSNLTHVLCGLILFGRLGDILSTRIVTRSLKLEANIVAKKLGWPFIWLTTLICLVPYHDEGFGIIVLVPSLLVSASNISKIWFVRSVGEDEYIKLLYKAARKGKLRVALLGVVLSSFFVGLSGFVLTYLSWEPEISWGFWFGLGIISYSLAMLVHGTTFFVRIYKKAKHTESNSN